MSDTIKLLEYHASLIERIRLLEKEKSEASELDVVKMAKESASLKRLNEELGSKLIKADELLSFITGFFRGRHASLLDLLRDFKDEDLSAKARLLLQREADANAEMLDQLPKEEDIESEDY